MITPENVKNALRAVTDAATGRDVVEAGMISGIAVRGGKVGFVITIDAADKDSKAWLREACERAVAAMEGVEAVTAVLTAQGAQPIPPSPQSGYDKPRERAVWNITPIEGVKRVIAIASGKGGVGKSTLSVNLAFALSRRGQRVGLLDADIYGPSLPRMLGLSGQPEIVEGKMMPLENHGIACMSMGFLTGDEAAILRGPMISKTLHQLLRFTRWAHAGDIDTLLVDMPPGTGDIHLSMAQQVPLAGAVIVTTPQEIAAMDARKALKMFQKVDVPILGVVENMSGSVFGAGGGAKLAADMQVAFLGDVPMDAAIVQACEEGVEYGGAQRAAYDAIAAKLT